jgi:hypothetical protein
MSLLGRLCGVVLFSILILLRWKWLQEEIYSVLEFKYNLVKNPDN